MKKTERKTTFVPWEEVTIRNNFMFSCVMTDEAICKEFIETMLGIEIDHIEYLEREKAIEADPQAKGIRLDVYVKDSERTFDLEMQCSDKKDLAMRTRFYQSAIDIGFLDKGRKYKELPESYVMFICTFDPFKRGLPAYTFRNICVEDRGLFFDDKTQKVFYNVTKYMDEADPKKRAVLEYFFNGTSGDDFTGRMEAAVREGKKRREWRETYMYFFQELEEEKEIARYEGLREGRDEGLREGREEGREEGLKEGREEGLSEGRKQGEKNARLETAKNLLSHSVSPDIISSSTGLSIEQVEALKLR